MGASQPTRGEGLPIICGKTQVSKATGPKRRAQDCPPLPMRMHLVLFGGRVTQLLAVASPDRLFDRTANSPASAVATARRARRRSDSVSASSNRFSHGQAREKFLRALQASFFKSYPRNRTAVLVLPADQTPDQASSYLLPWKVNYMKDASDKFGHRRTARRICVARPARCGRRRVAGCPSVSCPNLIEEVRVNGVKIIQP